MTIRTQSYAMDLEDLVRLIRKRSTFNVALVYFLVSIVAMCLLWTIDTTPIVRLAGGATTFVACMVLWPSQLRKRLSVPDYRSLFRSRIAELEDGVLRFYVDDGIRTDIPLTSFIRVERRLGYYLLFLTPDQFLFLPEQAFREPEDRERFRAAILAAIPKQVGF